jgi:BASS family bile acid:Na+ symporter
MFITPLLIVSMTLSLMGIELGKKTLSGNIVPSVKAAIINYVILSGFIIATAFIFISDQNHLSGFILLAAMPPPVLMIPFTHIIRGDKLVSLGGQILCYILALGMAPLITLAFLGSSIDIIEILKLLVLLVIIPLIASRALRRLPESLFRSNKSLINVTAATVTYTIMGLNQSAITGNFSMVLPILIVMFLKSYIIGSAAFIIYRKLAASKEKAISYTLFTIMKNGGMATAFAITLVGPAASLPFAFSVIFDLSFFFIFQQLVRRY